MCRIAQVCIRPVARFYSRFTCCANVAPVDMAQPKHVGLNFNLPVRADEQTLGLQSKLTTNHRFNNMHQDGFFLREISELPTRKSP